MKKTCVTKIFTAIIATSILVSCQNLSPAVQNTPVQPISSQSDGFQILSQAPSPKPLLTTSATPKPSLSPTATPKPSISPSTSPTPKPSLSPSPSPTATPSASPTATPSASAADFNKLSLTLELHIENSMIPNDQETDYLIQIAQAARNAGVTLSIGLGVSFLRSYDHGATVHAPANGDFTLSSLVSLLQNTYGHRVSLHADVPENYSYAQILTYLPPFVRELNDAGAQGSVASGACNETGTDGGWVKGALDSGVTTIAGVVEDCQASLSSSSALWIDGSTATPSRFHDAAPKDNPAQRAQGWFTNNVSNWITPYSPTSTADLNASLYIVGSMGDAHPACLAETAAGTACGDNTTAAQGSADASAMLADLAQVLDHDRSGTAGDAYHAAFSTNMVVTTDWLNAFFTTLASGIQTGTTPGGISMASAIQYSTLGAVADANRAEAQGSLP